MSFPKVLILGQPFNKNTGGGITLSNLFANWDKDKIAVTCVGHLLSDIDTRICDTYYQLGKDEHKWAYPFNKLQRNFKSGLLQINESTKENNPVQKKGIRKKLIDQVFYPFLKYFGLFHTVTTISLSQKFCLWVSQFKPEILYVQVSERDGILFAHQLSSFLKIPMIIHIMDDWPSTISAKGPLKSYWSKKIDNEFRSLLNKASLLMSISDEMGAEYKSRYNKDFLTFHNPINISFWKQYQKINYTLNDTITILYAGRIGIGIETSLKLIAKAIQQLNGAQSKLVKFILQTQETLPWFSKYDCVIHRPFISYTDLPKKFSEADLLILPYDFSEEAISFIKYSMPTKAPEYMMSGTPILIIAPETTAIVKNAKRLKWAKVITKNDISEISNGLNSFIQNKNERETIANSAKIIAQNNYDSNIITNRFRKIICSLSEPFNND